MAYKGNYIPQNPQKYKGDPQKIIYRSLWERRVMNYLDNHSQILWWSSEELAIPYVSPVDQRVHKYYVDFIFHVLNKNGKTVTHMWEIKPYKQTVRPEQKRRTKKFLQEAATYAVNQEKWKAAELLCLQNNWKFSLITEKDIKF
jgi:hypothetical protein